MGKVIYRRHTMDIPNYYAIIPAKIRYDKELMANAKLLYGEITALCNDKGICWARNEYFADLYDVSNETISRWISQLNKKKYIKVKMFYKKDSKEIDKRIISINQYPIDENVNTYCQENQSNTLLTKTSIPYIQKNQGGIDKNIKENITSINNKKEEERNFQQELKDVIEFFKDFYSDFEENRAYDMLSKLNINPNDKLKTMSKGTREKVQLILVMSRQAKLYFLDEPIGGVDPAARDYILNTIISNYNPEAAVIISTHLISDIEKVLDDVVMIKNGELVMHKKVDEIREEYGKSVDEVFREVFRC